MLATLPARQYEVLAATIRADTSNGFPLVWILLLAFWANPHHTGVTLTSQVQYLAPQSVALIPVTV